MARFSVGQLVVCVKTNDPKWSVLVGAVGEIKDVIEDDLISQLFKVKYEYIVDFPACRDIPCPGCGLVHGEFFGMGEDELKPLEDPDANEVSEDKKLDLGLNV